MISVQVKPFATLRRHFADIEVGEAVLVELPDEATVGDLLSELDVPREQVKIVFVNGTVQKQDYSLSDGDEIGLFPPVGGG